MYLESVMTYIAAAAPCVGNTTRAHTQCVNPDNVFTFIPKQQTQV